MSSDTPTVLESPAASVEMRQPAAADGEAVWRFVHDTPGLDENSPYAYLLLCSHFSDTGVVAHLGGELAGFVLGYMRPDEDATAFVWQVAVAPAARGRGLGGRLLDTWFAQCARHAGARFLEATVTPSNDASRGLFASFAERHDAPFQERMAFPRLLFPDPEVEGGEPHEDEIGIRIGPIAPFRTFDPHQENT